MSLSTAPPPQTQEPGRRPDTGDVRESDPEIPSEVDALLAGKTRRIRNTLHTADSIRVLASGCWDAAPLLLAECGQRPANLHVLRVMHMFACALAWGPPAAGCTCPPGCTGSLTTSVSASRLQACQDRGGPQPLLAQEHFSVANVRQDRKRTEAQVNAPWQITRALATTSACGCLPAFREQPRSAAPKRRRRCGPQNRVVLSRTRGLPPSPRRS